MSDEREELIQELVSWVQELQWQVNALREIVVDRKLVTEEHLNLWVEDAKTEDLLRLRAEARARFLVRREQSGSVH